MSPPLSLSRSAALHAASQTRHFPSLAVDMAILLSSCRQDWLLWTRHEVSLVTARSISFKNIFKRGNQKKEDDDSDSDMEGDLISHDALKPSPWRHLSDHQVLAIRDKSKLPLSVRGELSGIPHLPRKFTELRHYNRKFVRSYFAKYGEASGIKPGVCWPSQSELEFKIKFEETFYPTINEMLVRKRKEREEKEKFTAQERQKIMDNLKKLPAIKAEFMRKYNEKLTAEAEEGLKREKQIQEVREYLGYDVAQGDTRFQEALLKMEEEKKSVEKASKKHEKQARIMATLAALAESEIKKATSETAAAPSTPGDKATAAAAAPSGASVGFPPSSPTSLSEPQSSSNLDQAKKTRKKPSKAQQDASAPKDGDEEPGTKN